MSHAPRPKLDLFAWEGFSFRHPEDWAPVTLTGSRREGYARLQGPGRVGCQVRWRWAKQALDAPKALESYFRLLARDAKRKKVAFDSDFQLLEGGSAQYRWHGDGQGRGFLFAGTCGRLFFLEVTGGRSDSLLPLSKSLLESFLSFSGEDREPWSLFSLRASLPSGLSPASKKLQSGLTWLTFRPRGATIEVGRLAFGKEILQRIGLVPWARAILRLPNGRADEGDSRVRLSSEGRFSMRTVGLVRLDAERNQLLCLRSTFKQSKWSPQWDWLESNES